MTETTDPFLWLEEVHGEAPLAWVRGQNERSLNELEGDARFNSFHEQALKIVTSTERIASPVIVGDRVRNFWQDEDHVRGIWREATLSSYIAGAPQWETLLDIDKLAREEDENWVWKGAYGLAPAYDRCIITLSRGGSDAAVRREFIVSERKFVADGFTLPEMKGEMAWIDQNRILVGGDIADDGLTLSGYPRVVRLWERGQSVEQSRIVFSGDHEDVAVWPGSFISDQGVYSYILQAHTFYERSYFQFTDGADIAHLPIPRRSSLSGLKNGLVVSLQENWTDKQAGFDYKSGDLVWLSHRGDFFESQLIFSPNSRQAIQSVHVNSAAIYVQLLDNIVGTVIKITGPSDVSGKSDGQSSWDASRLSLPGEGDVSLGSVNDFGEDLFLYFDSPAQPPTLYYSAQSTDQKLVQQTPHYFEAGNIVLRQYQATSADGTDIPYFVIGQAAVIDKGNAPTIQYGYGGFEVPVVPGYSAINGKLWLERGGVYVIANIRGGGEFGPRWHQAALKENRQRAYDDFFAVSEDLIAKGITSPERLGALGGSNGGLLMGVAMTQRPDLYKAIAIGVPLLDMLRFHKLLAGASWMGEYGDPDKPDERDYIEAYSPYQNLKDDAVYPKAYLFTSTKDDRVHPGHARKYAAKLEQAGHPFLYYENIEGGHGAAANLNQSAFRLALQYIYFARLLGLD